MAGCPYAVLELTQLHSNNISAIPSFLLQDSEFNVERHARPIAYAAYPFIVQTKASDICLGPMQRREEYDSDRVGYSIESDPGKSRMNRGVESGESLLCLSFFLLARKSAEENGDIP